MDKRAWRAEAIEARRSLTVDSAAYCRVLGRFLTERLAPDRRVLVYLALPGEVDLAGLIAAHPDPAARFAVTRTPPAGRTLSLHPFGVRLERHRYGYEQPVADAAELPDDTIGGVLVPGLAFDRAGTRLGRGMGYYDRLLARLADDTLFVGITGGYIVETLPAEPHDVAMTHLATDAWVRPTPLPADLPIGKVGSATGR